MKQKPLKSEKKMTQSANKCVSFDAHTVGKGIKREGLYLSAVLAGSGI